MNDGERFLRDAIDSVRKALEHQNWLAALGLTLTLPDICGKVVEPAASSSVRYANWFDRWLGDAFNLPDISEHGGIRLSGRDCYALRCAFLHEGRDVITEQRAREVLDALVFVRPQPWGVAHLNQFNHTLQLQVDIFCSVFCDAVERWLDANKHDQQIMDGLGEHARIWDMRVPI